MNSIVILGGGPAGLALAAGLSDYEQNHVTVIEKTGYDRVFSGEHLQSAILPIFESLKIPREILFDNSTLCDGIFGNWAGEAIDSKGFFNLYGCDFMLRRPEFEESLANYLKTKGVRFRLGTAAGKIENNKLRIGDESLNYTHLFDCTGRTSRHFNNQRIVFDNLLGVSFFDAAPGKNSAIVIESVENGWWYHASNKKMSITTYFTDGGQYQTANRNLQKELYKTKIIKTFCGKLEGNPQCRIAHTSILKAVPNGIKQLGDAYFSLDPLSSQGIFKAFKQAATVSGFFAESDFEAKMGEFYAEQQRIFFQNLKLREHFYRKGHAFYKSEFYKKRTELGLFSNQTAG